MPCHSLQTRIWSDYFVGQYATWFQLQTIDKNLKHIVFELYLYQFFRQMKIILVTGLSDLSLSVKGRNFLDICNPTFVLTRSSLLRRSTDL